MYIPQYESACFSNLPNLLTHILTGATLRNMPASVLGGLDPSAYDTVVLFLLDGFGWNLFSKARSTLRFFQAHRATTAVSKITSQFPSTTAVHMTTLHTGLPVGQSGVPEWWYYEPALGRVFAPLLHSTWTNRGLMPLSPKMSPRVLPAPTLYKKLRPHGVLPLCFQHERYARSPFSQRVCRGAVTVPFADLGDAVHKLSDHLQGSAEKPVYACVYLDTIDALAHRHGATSDPVMDALHAWDREMHKVVAPVLRARGRTLCLVTADHGLTDVCGKEATALDLRVPKLMQWLRRDRLGRPIAPTGGKRDVFVSVQDEYVDEALHALRSALVGVADVYTKQDLVQRGAFGFRPTSHVLNRIGELIVLPKDHALVWWSNRGAFDLSYRKADHGGLSLDELEIPLVVTAFE